MKSTWVVVVAAMVLAGGCSREPVRPSPSGVGMAYTGAGALLSELELVDGVYRKKGMGSPFSGLAVAFHEDGKRRSESYFLGGKLHGPQIQWRRDGSLFSLSVHDENRVVYLKEYGQAAGAPE